MDDTQINMLRIINMQLEAVDDSSDYFAYIHLASFDFGAKQITFFFLLKSTSTHYSESHKSFY